MKNLKHFFKLSLFSFLFYILAFQSTAWAVGCNDTLDTAANSIAPYTVISSMHNITATTSTCISGTSIDSDSTNKRDYYYFTVKTDGVLSMSTSSPDGSPFHLKIGTFAGDEAYYSDQTAEAHTISNINLSAGDTVYFYFKETGGDEDQYQMDMTFTAGSPPGKSISIDNVSLYEGTNGQTTAFKFTVTSENNPKGGETVKYIVNDGTATTGDNDYTDTSGTVTFNKNDTSEEIIVYVQGDINSEADETFTVELFDLVGSGGGLESIHDGIGIGTIIDDEPDNYALTMDSIVVNESIGTANILVRVDPAIHDDSIITINYSTVDDTAVSGSDFTAVSNATLTIDKSNTSGLTTLVSIPIIIANDTVAESQEALHVQISNATIASLNHTVSIANDTGDITINDDDDGGKPSLSVNDVAMVEGDIDKYMTFTVSLSEILSESVVFSYTTVADTATSGVDFILETNSVATIPANTQNITIPITIIGDLEAGEGDETLKLVVNTASSLVDLGKSIGIGTIQDNDTGLSLTIDDAYIAEKDFNVTADVTIRFSQALNSDLNLTYSTQDGSAVSPDDYNGTALPQIVTIPSGSTEYLLKFNIIGDDIEETNERFDVTIDSIATSEAVIIARGKAEVVIFDDDAPAGCSSYVGMLTINEYQNNPNYKDEYGHPLADNAGKVPGNYVEIKYLDFLVKQYIVKDLWTLTVYTTAGSHQLKWEDADNACIDPRYEIFQMDNNVMGAEGYVVVRDHNGNEVDVLNIDDSHHYNQQCQNFKYDTDFDSDAQNKDIYREPDGTGDWVDHGNGANSGGSRCINRDGDFGLLFTKFDAIDIDEEMDDNITITDAGSVPIKTKVVNRLFDLNIISIEPETGHLINSDLTVRTYLANAVTGARLPSIIPVDVTFTDTKEVTGINYTYDRALQRVRIRFEYCGNDLGAYQNWGECWVGDSVIEQSNRRVSHSRDMFALRPDIFDMSISHADFPDLLVAGVNYTVNLRAPDGTNVNTAGYNQGMEQFNDQGILQTDINISTTTLRFFKDRSEDNNGSLVGNLNLTGDFSFTNGLAAPLPTIQYSDVGLVTMRLEDRVWASVDNIDTPQDCTSDSHTYVCGDLNATFIPDHFEITATLKNHRAGRFTYMTYYNNLSMSAHLEVNITAMSENNTTTQNFREGALYYENDINVTFNIPTTTATGESINLTPAPSTGTGGFSAVALGFDSGTVSIGADANSSENGLMFGYNKLYKELENPFDVNGSDIQVDINSTYSNDANTSSRFVDGSIKADENATFYYAKITSSKTFYEDIPDPTVITPVSVSVYCTTGCDSFGLGAGSGEPDWYLSSDHQDTQADGNVVLRVQDPPLVEGLGAPTVYNQTYINPAPLSIDNSNGQDPNVVVSSGANPSLPMTVKINIASDTSPWLIYNSASEDYYPSPLYKVRFLGGEADWAGVGKSGHAMDVDLSIVPSNRMDW